jgi:hypothetical protein
VTGQRQAAPALLVAAATTGAVLAALDRLTGKGFRRQNYRGRTVTLSAGPAVSAGLLAGATCAPEALRSVVCAVGGAAVAGAYDDWASGNEDERRVKGFAGHLQALRGGRASAGTVKLLLVGASALGAGRLRRGPSAEAVLDGCLVAGTANLANLLDLRPGRTLKVFATLTALRAQTVPAPYRALVAASFGAAVAALPADLGERSMLGDTGANAAGAMLGLTLCESSRRVRIGILAAVVALTGLSEKVSFSAVIAGNPLLRRLDELGRSGG